MRCGGIHNLNLFFFFLGGYSRSEIVFPRFHLNRIHLLELCFAVFLFISGCYDFLYGRHYYYIYLFLQTITFSITGFGYIGTIVP